MLPLQPKRLCDTSVDPKQVLRAHIDQLPLERQREFVITAFQLIAARPNMGETEGRTSTRVHEWH
jgi:hypothetical protein